ncbi:MAG: hypothetical protein R3C11_03095 [Planctomycetaceae bacterium]
MGTDGPGGGTFSTPEELAENLRSYWPEQEERSPYIVCTGGEPLLQIDSAFIKAVHDLGMLIAIETNGTRLPPQGIDWVCVSPKAGSDFQLKQGNELKLVYPQPEALPEVFAGLEFDHFYLQPMDGPQQQETPLRLSNTASNIHNGSSVYRRINIWESTDHSYVIAHINESENRKPHAPR